MTAGLYIAATVVSLLLAGNVYFLKKVFDKVDENDKFVRNYKEIIGKYQVQIEGLQKEVSLLQARISDLTSSLKELIDLKADVAVLKFAVNSLQSKHSTKIGKSS